MGKKAKKLAARIVRKRLTGSKGRFYQRPQALINWKTDENGEFVTDKAGNRVSTVEEYESDWGELFFDLIYVAMAFKLGDIVFVGVDTEDYSMAAIFFFSIYLTMHEAWLTQVTYNSRYNALGVFHQILDILQGASLGWAAMHIGTVEEFLEVDVRFTAVKAQNISNGTRRLAEEETSSDFKGYNYALGFSICITIFFVLQAVRSKELIYYGEFKDDLGDPKAIHTDGDTNFRMNVIRGSFYAAGIVTAAAGYIYETTTVWFLGALVPRYIFVARFLLQRFYKIDVFKCERVETVLTIPQHLPAIIKRLGEWYMLMLGEGVLQIIIQVITNDNATTHNITFALAFCILAMIQLTGYANTPWEVHQHALRRSALRAVVWYSLNPFASASFILVGVGLKSVLKNHFKIGSPKEDLSRFVWLLCVGMTLIYALMFWMKALHPGFRSIFVNKKSIISWIAVFLLSLSFLLVPLLTTIDGLVVLLIVLVINIVIYTVSEGTNEFEDEVEMSAKVAAIAEELGDELTEEQFDELEEAEALGAQKLQETAQSIAAKKEV